MLKCAGETSETSYNTSHNCRFATASLYTVVKIITACYGGGLSSCSSNRISTTSCFLLLPCQVLSATPLHSGTIAAAVSKVCIKTMLQSGIAMPCRYSLLCNTSTGTYSAGSTGHRKTIPNLKCKCKSQRAVMQACKSGQNKPRKNNWHDAFKHLDACKVFVLRIQAEEASRLYALMLALRLTYHNLSKRY